MSISREKRGGSSKQPGCLDGLAITFTEVDRIGKVGSLEERKVMSSIYKLISECLRDAQIKIHAGKLYKPLQSLKDVPINLGGISMWDIAEERYEAQQVLCER